MELSVLAGTGRSLATFLCKVKIVKPALVLEFMVFGFVTTQK